MRTAQATRTGSDDPSGPKSRPWRLARALRATGARLPPNRAHEAPAQTPSGCDRAARRAPASAGSAQIAFTKDCSGVDRGLGAADNSIEEWTNRYLDAAVCGEMARSRESGGAVQAREFLVGRRQPASDAHPAETTA